jgi:hypothetical protein
MAVKLPPAVLNRLMSRPKRPFGLGRSLPVKAGPNISIVDSPGRASAERSSDENSNNEDPSD